MKTNSTQQTISFDPQAISSKWQEKWKLDKLYQIDLDSAKKPHYTLMMFPYPSAEGLHIGGIYTFTGVDAYARFKHMRGYDSFEPFGLDAFGIHSENYALKTGKNPMDLAKVTEENFYRQMQATGSAIDWSRKLQTNDPNYYKWTQWLFIELFKHGLAERKKAKVNFCPSCKTVLADEQVIDGKCERCGSVVEKRDLEQWFFKITKYADRLLNNIEGLDWAQKVKTAQTNWIGKSEGAQIEFKIHNAEFRIEVFTTRPDTLYGATFVVVAPDSEYAKKILKQIKDEKVKRQVEVYLEAAQNKSEQDRLDEGKEKTGVFSGVYAIHPLTNEQLPIWIADYVLGSYGTGAIMAVPAHDKRDFEFAKKYKLAIKAVIESKVKEQPYIGKGKIINSDAWNGLIYPQDTTKILSDIEKKNIGKKKNTYHLRDWLISRQRYWGPPIPMIYCEKCAKEGKSWFNTEEAKTKKQIGDAADSSTGWYPVSETDLPVLLPYIEDFKPLGTGKAPLANHPEFYEALCPECGNRATRETDVSDTFLDSSWYFLRYLATDWQDKPFPMSNSALSSKQGNFREVSNEADESKNRLQFLPVTIYIGGAEHSVLHLLYARFITMFFKDRGYIDFEEPFSKFYAHGLIIKDGAKMSKSKGNVILPDPLIQKFGIDTLRLYLRFLGPFDQDGDFRDTGIEGMHRFVKRIWTLFSKEIHQNKELAASNKKIMHETIKAVTDDMEALRFNTAIAKLMTWYNFLSQREDISHEEAKVYLQLLAPFAPHITEELWERLGQRYSIHTSEWPTFDPSAFSLEQVTIAIQLNGKLRDTIQVDAKNLSAQQQIEELAKSSDKVKNYLDGKTIIRTIYVPGKIINFVVK